MVRDQLLFLSGRGWGRLEDVLGYYMALYGNGGGEGDRRMKRGTIENWQSVSGGSIECYEALLGDQVDFITIQTKFSHPPSSPGDK